MHQPVEDGLGLNLGLVIYISEKLTAVVQGRLTASLASSHCQCEQRIYTHSTILNMALYKGDTILPSCNEMLKMDLRK